MGPRTGASKRFGFFGPLCGQRIWLRFNFIYRSRWEVGRGRPSSPCGLTRQHLSARRGLGVGGWARRMCRMLSSHGGAGGACAHRIGDTSEAICLGKQIPSASNAQTLSRNGCAAKCPSCSCAGVSRSAEKQPTTGSRAFEHTAAAGSTTARTPPRVCTTSPRRTGSHGSDAGARATRLGVPRESAGPSSGVSVRGRCRPKGPSAAGCIAGG